MILKSLGLLAVVAFAAPALAQSPALSPQDLPSNGGAGVRTPYITSTGATVADPGASQSGGVTPMDRGIAKKDNQIDTSICKGC